MVLFHELVHWTMHATRLNRPAGNFGDAYAKEELVAELGAASLMRHFGIGIGDTARHAKYFQCWLDRTNSKRKALAYAKKEANRAVCHILKHGTVSS